MSRLGTAGFVPSSQGVDRHGTAGVARQVMVRHALARHGTEWQQWHGPSRPDVISSAQAGRGQARHGAAGMARRGSDRWGVASQVWPRLGPVSRGTAGTEPTVFRSEDIASALLRSL